MELVCGSQEFYQVGPIGIRFKVMKICFGNRYNYFITFYPGFGLESTCFIIHIFVKPFQALNFVTGWNLYADFLLVSSGEIHIDITLPVPILLADFQLQGEQFPNFQQ